MTCGKKYGKARPEYQNVRFICPDDKSQIPEHITSVVLDPTGVLWARLQTKILHYELYWSPIKWFNSWWGLLKGRIGLYLTIRFIIIALALILSSPFCNNVFLNSIIDLISIVIIFDIVLVTTSAAFISRYFSVPLRSVLLTLFSFIQIVIGFSVFYHQLGNYFKETTINQLQALYFSFVTLTTLGYGDFTPCYSAWHIQSVIILQLILGLYFLTIMLSVITNWVNMLPVGIPTKKLADILIKVPKTRLISLTRRSRRRGKKPPRPLA